jgi:hypothetical protein
LVVIRVYYGLPIHIALAKAGVVSPGGQRGGKYGREEREEGEREMKRLKVRGKGSGE